MLGTKWTLRFGPLLAKQSVPCSCEICRKLTGTLKEEFMTRKTIGRDNTVVNEILTHSRNWEDICTATNKVAKC